MVHNICARSISKYKLYFNFLVIVFFLIFINEHVFANISNYNDISNYCEKFFSLDYPDPQKKLLIKTCDNYKELNDFTKKLIDDYNLPQTYPTYSEGLIVAEQKIASISDLVNILRSESSSELNQELDHLLQISKDQFQKSKDSFFRAQQDVYNSGGFLIGSYGYIKVLGEDTYLSEGGRPIKLTVVPSSFAPGDESMRDSESKRCPNSKLVSLELYQNSNFQNKLLAKYKDNLILETSKVLLYDKQAQSVFCTERSGNGIILRLFGDTFINKNANGLTKDSKKAGVFTFVPALKSQKSQQVEHDFNLNNSSSLLASNRFVDENNYFIYSNKLSDYYKNIQKLKQGDVGPFVFGKVGYIGVSDENIQQYIGYDSLGISASDKNYEQTKIYNPIRFIIQPIDSSERSSGCTEDNLAVRFEFFDQKGYFLSRDEWMLKQNKFDDTSSTKYITFCIEPLSDYYLVKDNYGYYLNNEANGFTKNPDEFGKYLYYNKVNTMDNNKLLELGTEDSTVNFKKIEYHDYQQFQNGSIGYVKPKNSDWFLAAKDINTNTYSINNLSIIHQDPGYYNYCSLSNSFPVIITNQSNEILVNYYGSLYFINENINISDKSKVFCLLRSDELTGHYIYSIFGEKIAYLSDNGIGFANDLNNSGIFELASELKYDDINKYFNLSFLGSFHENNYGYLKLINTNKYLSLALYEQGYNNRAGFPIKFKLVAPVQQNPAWCQSGTIVSFESSYNPGKYLVSNNLDDNVTLLDVSFSDSSNQAVEAKFCLERDTIGFMLKNASGRYISKKNPGTVTSDKTDRGYFRLVSNYLDTGLTDTQFIRKFEGNIIYTPGTVNSFLSIDSGGKLLFTNEFFNSQSFEILPALINKFKSSDNCVSIKSHKYNKYISYDNKELLLKNKIDTVDFAQNSSFCPIYDLVNDRTFYYLFNNRNYFLANQDKELMLLYSKEIPVNDEKFYIANAHPRDIAQKLPALEKTFEKNYCANLQPRGKIISSKTRVIPRGCDLLPVLKTIMNEIDLDYNFTAVDITGQCCSLMVDYIPTEAIPINNEECQVSYDIICDQLNISNPGFL